MITPNTSHDLFADAKSGTDHKDGVSDQDTGASETVRKLFRQIWPKKTAIYVAIAGDITIRQAERIVAGHQGLSFPVFSRLLRSEHGAAILEAAMAGAKPGWWKEAFHERQIASARRRRQEADRELRRLEAEEGA